MVTLYFELYERTLSSRQVYEYYANRLDEGYTFIQLWEATLKGVGVSSIPTLSLPKKPTGIEQNLLSSKQRYFAKELLILPDAPVSHFDLENGTTVRTKQEFFVEQVASFTMQELIDLTKSYRIFDKELTGENRLIGSLQYLCSNYSIDLILEGLRLTSQKNQTEQIYCNSPSDIEKQFPDAKQALYKTRMGFENNHTTTFVPRKRKLHKRRE